MNVRIPRRAASLAGAVALLGTVAVEGATSAAATAGGYQSWVATRVTVDKLTVGREVKGVQITAEKDKVSVPVPGGLMYFRVQGAGLNVEELGAGFESYSTIRFWQVRYEFRDNGGVNYWTPDSQVHHTATRLGADKIGWTHGVNVREGTVCAQLYNFGQPVPGARVCHNILPAPGVVNRVEDFLRDDDKRAYGAGQAVGRQIDRMEQKAKDTVKSWGRKLNPFD